MAGLLQFEDTAGIDYPNGQLITEGDEGESVAAAIAEVTEEEAGLAEDERDMDQLVDDEESATEVERVLSEDAPKMEHAGLTPTNARIAKVLLKNLLGSSYTERKFPKMEHFDSRAGSRESTAFIQEDISSTLKGFWETLKAQFKKMWEKLKTWYVKTFSAAKKLNQRAVDVRNRAENASSTIDKKTFKFSQTKLLTVGGRLKDYGSFKSAMTELARIVTITNDSETDKTIDAIEDGIDAALKGGAEATGADKFNRIVEGFQGRYASVLKDGGNDLPDSEKKLLESLGGGADGIATIKVSNTLPGDKLLALITGKPSTEDSLRVLRATRLKIINSKFKPKEVSADVEVTTLNTSQVSEICNIIVDSSAQIFEFEQTWKKTDRAQETFLRKLDELARDAEDAVKDKDDHKGTDISKVRTKFSTATNFVKSIGGVPSMVSSFALPAYGAALNYCEGSMRNYK